MTTVFIISAPSGSGKSTLVRWLLDHDKKLEFSVSYTTRQPRGNEITGSDYHFIDRPAFEQKLANHEFLEHAEVFGNYYGTHRGILEEAEKTGKDVILDIDIEGARQLKEKLPQCISIFVLAPSRKVLEQRLRARSASERKVQSRIDDDIELVIQKRLRKAADEIRNYSRYDYVLVNDDLARSKETLASIVAAERVRRIRVEPVVQAILASFGQ
ncbi:MAG: guanylate kinase [Bryobacteraceae bacterium]|nr:guanylate kinase [Bryobacteraceae bacterium]